MNHSYCSFAKVAASVLIAVLAFALAPTLIDPTVSQAAAVSNASSHSWLADAFPTGQATFARSTGHGN